MLNKNNFFSQLWDFFASVKFAVVLLILLAVTSVIGTILPQNAPSEYYIKEFGLFWYNLYAVLELTDMYHAPWFLFILLLLCLNIIVCSIDRLKSTWKIIFPDKIKFNPDRFRKKKNLHDFNVDSSADEFAAALDNFLKKNVGKVLKKETDKGFAFYSEKGRWTRFGVYFVHLSILLLLVGAVIGSLLGFKGSMQLNPGEQSNIVRLSKSFNVEKLDFNIRCNDFKVKFYDSGAPEEFRSDLTLIADGKEILTKSILVNHPLRYRGINIFQSSYGTSSFGKVKFSIQSNQSNLIFQQSLNIGETADLPGGAGTFKYEKFLSDFNFRGHNLGQAVLLTVSFKNKDSVQITLPVKFPTFDKMRKGEFSFIVDDVEQVYYTGLQITKDPGVKYVYAGFILMIIGCWVTFFMSHQIIYVEIEKISTKESKIYISGTTNKNSQNMKIKINKYITRLKEIEQA